MGIVDAPAILLASTGPSALGLDVLLILAAAGLVALVFARLHVATIPGYIVAGALIGPHGLNLMRDPASVESISSLATILLLFTIGLQLDMGHVRRGLVSIVATTIVSTVLVVVLGWPLGRAAGVTPAGSVALWMAMSISCTSVVLKILETRRELHSAPGRITFGIVLFQDLVALGMLAAIPVIAAWAGSGGAPSRVGGDGGLVRMAGRASLAIGGTAALIIIGRLLLPRLLREAARRGGGELLLVISAAIALGAAVLMAALGLSPELGAFLSGFLLASTMFRHQIAGQLVPMRDLFLALFFTSVGLGLPVREVLQGWWVVAPFLVAVIVIKALAIGGAAWAFGAYPRAAAMSGMSLSQSGEFSLVLLAQATAAGLLSERAHGYAVAVVVLSIMVTPLLFRMGRRLGGGMAEAGTAPWIRGGAAEPEPQPSPFPETGMRAVVAGFGPVGRAVADRLTKQGVAVTIVETNPRTVERQALIGRSIVYGDASNLEVMLNAGIESADAVILTMPDEDAMLRACRLARSVLPNGFIAVRANALSRGLQAMQVGADHAVIEELATAEAMANEVMIKLAQRSSGEDPGPKLYEFEQDGGLRRAAAKGDLPP